MKCKLVIFDLDGTILNTIDDLAASANHICKIHGYPEHSVEEIKYMVGNGIPKLVERMLPKGTDPEIQKSILSEFSQYYKDHSQILTKPYDGITELLHQLKEEGIKTAVNSNKIHDACVPLCNFYFPDLFDYICGSKKENRTKPAPDGVYEIMNKISALKEETVYIGDSDVDFQTAVNSGISFIGAAWGFRGKKFLLENGAELVADKPSDIMNFLNL